MRVLVILDLKQHDPQQTINCVIVVGINCINCLDHCYGHDHVHSDMVGRSINICPWSMYMQVVNVSKRLS